jgi:hypothetical protein
VLVGLLGVGDLDRLRLVSTAAGTMGEGTVRKSFQAPQLDILGSGLLERGYCPWLDGVEYRFCWRVETQMAQRSLGYGVCPQSGPSGVLVAWSCSEPALLGPEMWHGPLLSPVSAACCIFK